jgi:hypothetical protein
MPWTVGARLRHFVHARWVLPLADHLDRGAATRSDRRGTPSSPNSEGLDSHVVAGDPDPGSGSELLAREMRELRSALDSANAEVEETHTDAVRLQGERDDALRDADDVRLQILSEVAAAMDDEIRVQDRIDEALRLVDDGRDQASDQASEEQWRLIEELDVLHEELAVCRQRACRGASNGPPAPGGG